MRVVLFVSCLQLSWGFMDWMTSGSSPPPDGGGGSVDMSATFAKLPTCKECVGAGYGWCPNRRKCGGFANKECGSGERYVVEGYAPERKARISATKKRSGAGGAKKSGGAGGSGVDMRATFAKLRTCSTCVAAGYGWCPLKRMCGGFANKECGVGERYVAEGMSRAEADAEAESVEAPKVEVPAASPSPPATILHASDVGASTVALKAELSADASTADGSDDGEKDAGRTGAAAAAVGVSPTGAQQAAVVEKGTDAVSARQVLLSSPGDSADRRELYALSYEQLIERVLALRAEVESLRQK